MRRYYDPVDVHRRDDVPAEFLWRGRIYLVREVLSHWVETGAWWRTPAAAAVFGTDDADAGAGALMAPAEVSTSVALDQGGDREMWRVEASAGRLSASGVFDLCFEWAQGTWRLTRAMD